MRACFAAEPRLPMNKSGLRRLRQSGRIPAVIIGLNQESEQVHVSARDFTRWIRGGGSGLLEIQVNGSEAIPVLLEGVQRDTVTRDYIHVDFLRVLKDEPVRAKVVLDYVGTPAGAKLGGILQTHGNFIEVEALPHFLPPSISVDISKLAIGGSLCVGDISLPVGLKLLSPANEQLLSIIVSSVHLEEAPAG